jgi:hypothetical protein
MLSIKTLSRKTTLYTSYSTSKDMIRFGCNCVALAFAVRRIHPEWPDRM